LTGSDARGDLHLAKVAGFDSSPSHALVAYAHIRICRDSPLCRDECV
jgi:hypothetical protein